MTIKQWRQVYKRKIKGKCSWPLIENRCHDMSDSFSVDNQLLKLKGNGKHKIFYLECVKPSWDTFNDGTLTLRVVSDEIFIDEPQYL
jgi:hypothetical protein